MREIISFHPQPDFPIEDISDNNAAIAEVYLASTNESEVYLDIHRSNLKLIHGIGNSALIAAGTSPGNNRNEYDAFCHGFTTIDYLATLLDSRPFTQIKDGSSMNRLFIQHGEMADFELWQRREMWLQTHTKTMDILRGISDSRDETPKQLVARAMGAQVASEILY